MTDDKDIKKLVKEAYDMHFHVGPDILPRKYDDVDELIKEEKGRIGGIALKAHSFPTMTYIQAAHESVNGLKLIGSITLNYFMGGFNPSAVYASAMMSKKYPLIVWFPTIHAENHLISNKSEYEIPPEWIKDPSFKPRPKADLKAIRVTNWAGRLIRKAELVLDTMQEMGCVLATGHVNWREAERLSLEAIDRGIKVIVTHPMQRDISMPLEVQERLAGKGAFIEYCYIMYLDRDNPGDYPLEEQSRCIREIGVDQCILTSDAGQVRNPGSSDSIMQYMNLLKDHDLGLSEFRRMVVDNPVRILGK
ncbi:MAG: DUF6282 family protein [Candidatus Altiarchaeota archaeon]